MALNSLEADRLDIIDYTSRFPELKGAHHFVFNEVRPPGTKPAYVIMGINPGESQRPETAWTNIISDYVDKSPFVMTELFFWSSRNLTHFREKFGILQESPHLNFCVEKNKRLIRFYRPKAVICSGLGLISICQENFDLRYLRTGRRDDGTRTYELFKDENGITWIFTKHWTGARGYTKEDKRLIKEVIGREGSEHD
jgi:hypothetical protein